MAVVPIIEIISAPMTIMTVPITPVGSYGCACYCTNSCAATATYDASNHCTAQSRLRKHILDWHQNT
jgi:hypothetical protein